MFGIGKKKNTVKKISMEEAEMYIKEAVEQGNVGLVQAMIEKVYPVNIDTYNGNPSLLHLAVKTGNLKMVDLLIRAGADVNNGTKWRRDYKCAGCGQTPLMWAAKYDYQKIVLRLLMSGALVNVSDYYNHDTALHYAAKYASAQTVHTLLLWHANPNLANLDKETPLHYAADRKPCKDSYEMAYVLTTLFDAQVDGYTINGYSDKLPLYYAVKNENTELVKLLLKKRAYVNHISNDGATVLLYAARNKNIEMVKLLVENGASTLEKDRFGKTALYYVTRTQDVEAVKMLQKREKKDKEIIAWRESQNKKDYPQERTVPDTPVSVSHHNSDSGTWCSNDRSLGESSIFSEISSTNLYYNI